ncbi:Hydrogenase maturation protein, carbamoyl dehydratase HypE [Trichlorobacter thiogenes]|uniref:Hydrogenase maturation protein, carbamoyl dehydratase HypE n=1 Tax=Trichlorobacter thiogenes TaxID=115783 RepID=A0A1T4NW90_9BACT|nr:hydrogenase expression/formation protein HypE [Trichlorobacter thiogenes]SJZ83317.1 Hydrogenase maturation protein, carbamoyl dehydratase HypE [Trichlorobacter thiogenes]
MDDDLILLGHGSGGTLSHRLLDDLIVATLSGHGPGEQNDAALLAAGDTRLAFTTDGYVVDPPVFPGGTIGSLAVHGTVNDLAMMGARPLWLSCALIIEEGFSRSQLAVILNDMRQAADSAGVRIVTGDTKVVPRGKADRIFITTSGVGVLEHDLAIHGANARPGDVIILSGSMGDHGIAVMAAREGLPVEGLTSDSAPLWSLVEQMLEEAGEGIRVLRDPTRGGVATTLKEIAGQSGVTLQLEEDQLPVSPQVRGVCGILGLDPLYVANEGKLLVIVAPESAEPLLARMQQHPLGQQAAIIGTVEAGEPGRVRMRTTVGGMRVVEMLAGEQLPRIC